MNNTRPCKLVDLETLDLTKFNLEKNKSETLYTEKSNNELELILNEGSHLKYITFDKGVAESVNALKATLKRDSKLEIYNVVTSNVCANIKANIVLEEVGASVNIINLLLLGKDAVLDSKIDIYHNTEHTESDLSNYAIAKDNATLVLDNNATIKQKSSKSIAHQSTKGLTLSKNAKIKALPNLYIDEYDVIASHACSIGSVNKEDLFYLMSRGLTETEANKIVVMGYVKPILDHIEDETLKQKIEAEFANKLMN